MLTCYPEAYHRGKTSSALRRVKGVLKHHLGLFTPKSPYIHLSHSGRSSTSWIRTSTQSIVIFPTEVVPCFQTARLAETKASDRSSSHHTVLGLKLLEHRPSLASLSHCAYYYYLPSLLHDDLLTKLFLDIGLVIL